MSFLIYIALSVFALLIAGLLFRFRKPVKHNNILERTDNSSVIDSLKTRIQKLELIINSLPDGLIAVNKSLQAIVVNPFAREIFSLHSANNINQDIRTLINDESICSLIEKTISEDCSFSEEFTLKKPAKILKINTNPIKSDQDVLGAILFIEDITAMKNLEEIGSEFVSNVTHELKTPLTSIRGFIETLKHGAINDSQVAHKFLDIIDIEAERLFLLINDILALSEIETMKQDVDIANVPFESIVSDSLNILQGQAEKKNITINTEIEPNVRIQANKYRIMQLVLNLVDNSIKYSSEGSLITIKASRVGGDVVMSFKDTGIGIPSEHLSRIYERFYRVNKGRSRSLGGTGLGLSIVKHIVNLCNGNIKVYSELGKGTEFIVTLPC